MRKANFKTLFAALLVVFTFLLAGMGTVQAQNSVSSGPTGGLYGFPAKVTFVGSTQAQSIVTAHLDAIKAYMVTLPVWSPAYNTAYRATVYYRSVLDGLKGGKNVGNSIMDGVGMFLTDYFSAASYAEKLGLRQESIGLLSTANVPSPNTN